MGNGQFLRLQLSGSLERLQVNLSFTEPRFLDRNLAAGFDLFHKEVDQTQPVGLQQPPDRRQRPPRLPAVREDVDADQLHGFARPDLRRRPRRIARHPGRGQGTSYTSLVGTTLTYDLRNDAKNPTKGLWFQMGGDFAGLGGDVQYVSLAGEVRGYYPITDNITFVARGIAGSIHGWGGEDVRLIDLFFKGGETVRGFDRAGYGPRDLSTGDALGGQYYWATTAEIRFPIPFVPDDLGISGAVFADAGSLWDARRQRADRAGRLHDRWWHKRLPC